MPGKQNDSDNVPYCKQETSINKNQKPTTVENNTDRGNDSPRQFRGNKNNGPGYKGPNKDNFRKGGNYKECLAKDSNQYPVKENYRKDLQPSHNKFNDDPERNNNRKKYGATKQWKNDNEKPWKGNQNNYNKEDNDRGYKGNNYNKSWKNDNSNYVRNDNGNYNKGEFSTKGRYDNENHGNWKNSNKRENKNRVDNTTKPSFKENKHNEKSIENFESNKQHGSNKDQGDYREPENVVQYSQVGRRGARVRAVASETDAEIAPLGPGAQIAQNVTKPIAPIIQKPIEPELVKPIVSVCAPPERPWMRVDSHGALLSDNRRLDIIDSVWNMWEVSPFSTPEAAEDACDQWRNRKDRRLLLKATNEEGIEEIPRGVKSVGSAEEPVVTGGDGYPRLQRFGDFDFHPRLLDNLVSRCNYVKPTPIQRHAIPIILQGKDMMGSSQTGSGKTCAFMVPVIHRMLVHGPPLASRPKCPAPVCVVMGPTRELAKQIYEEGRKFADGTGLRCEFLVGGGEPHEAVALKSGIDILVATTGRLQDKVERKQMFLTEVLYLAVDEADRMVDEGFVDQVMVIINHMNENRKVHRRLSLLFSATFPPGVQQMICSILGDYVSLSVGEVGGTTDQIEQELHYVDDDRPDKKTVKRNSQILIFVGRKKLCPDLSANLQEYGFSAIPFSGDMVQYERDANLGKFRRREVQCLVATSVASRGLDIPDVELVVQYDVSTDISEYTHRIGRTGRAGCTGKAIAFLSSGNLVNSLFVDGLIKLLRHAGQSVPRFLESHASAGYRLQPSKIQAAKNYTLSLAIATNQCDEGYSS